MASFINLFFFSPSFCGLTKSKAFRWVFLSIIVLGFWLRQIQDEQFQLYDGSGTYIP